MADPTSQGPQAGAFRKYLPDLTLPRFTSMQGLNAHEYAHNFKTSGQPPWIHGLFLHWRELFKDPFRGITTDGTKNNLAILYSL